MVSKSDTYFLVIMQNDLLNNLTFTEGDLKSYCEDNENIVYYSLIKHDKDINECGELEKIHFHLLIKLKNSYAKSTIVNDLAKYLKCNISIIQSRRVYSFVKCCRYLIHGNEEDKEKYQYSLSSVITNDFEETYNIITKGVSIYEFDIDYLIKLVRNCRSMSEIYHTLGIKYSRMYRPIINDLWKERVR